ncbi:TasA family protein [Jatrophihabitans sp.]|uniref:TasA family protein n=1 Tax=Jatrophihabitans sp. TaxID=1932789 RepID=UPI002CB7664A|nr:TasA family protein [Jatrophihabitans sp.]
MSLSATTVRSKVLASAALLGAAAGAAGLGTFGSFTSATSASASVSSGSVSIALGTPNTAANRFSVAATGLVPGDTVQRAVTLSNAAGNQALASIALTTAATTSSKLDTDPTLGLQLKIDSCSVAWTETGTAPAYAYSCSGTTKSVLATRAVIGSNLTLNNLAALAANSTDNLVVTMTFPAAADNTFQNQSSVVNFTFTATQRAATNQ